MKTAIVTGSAGFIGRHISQELANRGWYVEGFDIRDHELDDFLKVMEEPGCWEPHDLVVHCAYYVGGRASIDGVNMNFAKNLQLDSAMFDWAVRTNQRRVLYFSSSAAYPIHLQQRFCWSCDETPLGGEPKVLSEDWIDLLSVEQPDADYGWAKLTGEKLAAAARRNGLRVSVVRPFSGYGETQSADYPFPSIVRRAAAGNLSVWGPRGQTRDWIHVDDVINGALAVVESETEDPVNLCTGRGVEMGELAEKVYFQASGEVPPDLWETRATYDESKPTGVFYRVGDPTRMLNYYEPKISLEEGIQRALQVLR